MAGRQVMIKVHWDGARVSVDPDPAFANVGEDVRWELSYHGEPLSCTVYFAHGSPFAVTEVGFSRVSVPVVPSQAGEWKYGVRVQRGAATLADDDPRLVVRS